MLIKEKTYRNVINNELTATTKTRKAICPSTEEPLWDAPISTQADVDRAVSAARAAFPAWRKLSYDERAAYLVKLADAITANKQGFIDLLGREAGKPPQAAAFELSLVDAHITTVPTLRLPEETPEDNADVCILALFSETALMSLQIFASERHKD